MSHERKSVVYIAMSLDGFIAGLNEDLSFLDAVQLVGEDYGYADFMSSVDTVVMGRKTFDWILRQVPAFPHAELNSYIVTRTPRPDDGKIMFSTEDPCTLIKRLKSLPGKYIFIDGGADIINQLIQQDLIDEWIISIIPALLGDGIALFHSRKALRSLQLLSVRHFASGLVQLHYQKKFAD